MKGNFSARYLSSYIFNLIDSGINQYSTGDQIYIMHVYFMWQITDFGLSKSRGISSQTLESSSRERRPAGTIAYIAPERYQGEFDVSCDPIRACKADVYRYEIGDKKYRLMFSRSTRFISLFSYGVILWQIMVRMEPFRG